MAAPETEEPGGHGLQFPNMSNPDPTDFFNRRGRFRVHQDFLRDRPGDVMLATSQCLIFRAEMRYEDQCLHYCACSELFKESGDSINPPEYDALFEKQEDGSIKFLGFRPIPVMGASDLGTDTAA